MDLALHRGVLGRHAEGVPAHRVQHVVPGRACSAPPRRPSCSCARGPCGCAPTGRGTSPARSISGAGRRSWWRRCRARPRPSASAARPRGRCSGRALIFRDLAVICGCFREATGQWKALTSILEHPSEANQRPIESAILRRGRLSISTIVSKPIRAFDAGSSELAQAYELGAASAWKTGVRNSQRSAPR